MTGDFKRGVFLYRGKAVVHSCYLAEIAEKKHKKLLENNIRSRAKKLDGTFTTTNFIPTTYIDTNKQTQNAYLLTREGCLALAEKMRSIRAKRVRDHINKIFNAFARKQNNRIVAVPTEKPKTINLGVFIKDGKPMVSSRKVAEVFEKEHSGVMRAIRNLECDEEFSRCNFALTEFKDVQNKTQPEYLMTRDGFTILAMGFTGKKAMEFKLKYIAAFNEMEKRIQQGIFMPNFNDPVAAALAWAENEKQKQFLAAKIEEDAPKVKIADAFLLTKTDIDAKTYAQILKQGGLKQLALKGKLVPMGQNNFIWWLLENHFICRVENGFDPIGMAKRKDLIKIVPTEIKRIGKTYLMPYIKAAGQVYFIKELLRQEAERNQLEANDIKLLTAPDQNDVPRIDFSQKKRKAK